MIYWLINFYRLVSVHFSRECKHCHCEASKQYLEEAFVIFIEHSKNAFMCAVDLFDCKFIAEQPDQRTIIELDRSTAH